MRYTEVSHHDTFSMKAYYSNYSLSPNFYIKLQSTKVSIKVFQGDK